MTTKHTPGPWKCGDWGRNMVGVSDGAGWIECWVDLPDGNRSLPFASARNENVEANARLIAAAPDLLTALADMEEAYCRAGSPLTRKERTEDRKRLMAARAAIAKATGAAA